MPLTAEEEIDVAAYCLLARHSELIRLLLLLGIEPRRVRRVLMRLIEIEDSERACA